MALEYREQTGDDLDTKAFLHRFERLTENVGRVVVAEGDTVRLALLGLVAQGHVLLEDAPGVGKTLLAKTIACSISGQFTRAQFTPDLLPSDITGVSIYNAGTGRFDFLPGPVFANVVLADELNRANPRTQSALLEAMAEGQVTADGHTRELPRPFMVIATQNTLDSTGTFPLPDTELDRFLVRLSIGLPSEEREIEILSRSEHDAMEVEPVLDTDDVLAMQRYVRAVSVAMPVKEYVVRLAAAIRRHPSVRGGMSPRASVHLMNAAQGWAAFEGRDFAAPDDVKAVAPSVLGHRLHTDARGPGAADLVIAEVLAQTSVPA